jgi:hypothetical protein
LNAASAAENERLEAHTIYTINLLPEEEKRAAYARLVPAELSERFHLPASFNGPEGEALLQLHCPEGSSSAEMALYHQPGFPDPLLYGQITDTPNGRVHVLLYVLNDPDSPRFAVDCLPDGKSTHFGTECRNLAAEEAAMRYGLAPGQVRKGLRMLGPAVLAFEHFAEGLGHDLYFAEPLYYHTAVLFERYGFAYQKGRRLMERIQAGFAPGGDLLPLLDGCTPFRMPEAANRIRLRSWALHDGLLREPFSDVTMYKRIGVDAGLNTCPDCDW